MRSDQLDLDIKNYTLQDMLSLLGLPVGFTKQHLRDAMKVVGALHPDKSDAPPGVYQLFYQAHLQCRRLLAAREQGNRRALLRDDYSSPNGRQIADEMTKRDDFAQWFNESFEQFHKTEHQKQGGHGEWLGSKGDDEQNQHKINNLQQMATEMANRRRAAVARAEARSLMLVDGPIAAEIGCGGGSLLVQEEESEIETDGGKVGDVVYSDVRRGYEDSVIPINETHGPEYSNMAELEAARGGQDALATEFWRNYDNQGEAERRSQELRMSTDSRMFALQKEQERQVAAHQAWQTRMMAITNKSCKDKLN